MCYNAQLQLEEIKLERKIAEKLNSPLRDQILEGEIQRIETVEEKAEMLLTTGVVDLFLDKNEEYIWEKEYLRIKADYYKTNSLPSIEPDLFTVKVYATHVYFKEFLQYEKQQFSGDLTDVLALEELANKEQTGSNVSISDLDPQLLYGDYVPKGSFAETRDFGIPIFKPEIIDSLFSILKDYFSEKDQLFLETLLLTGKGGPDKLLFLSKGNQLADVFWQLAENQLVINCSKAQLEAWIAQNFQYTDRRASKDFTLKYLGKIISTPHQTCQNPIIQLYKDPFTGDKLLKHI